MEKDGKRGKRENIGKRGKKRENLSKKRVIGWKKRGKGGEKGEE